MSAAASRPSQSRHSARVVAIVAADEVLRARRAMLAIALGDLATARTRAAKLGEELAGLLDEIDALAHAATVIEYAVSLAEARRAELHTLRETAPLRRAG